MFFRNRQLLGCESGRLNIVLISQKRQCIAGTRKRGMREVWDRISNNRRIGGATPRGATGEPLGSGSHWEPLGSHWGRISIND